MLFGLDIPAVIYRQGGISGLGNAFLQIPSRARVLMRAVQNLESCLEQET